MQEDEKSKAQKLRIRIPKQKKKMDPSGDYGAKEKDNRKNKDGAKKKKQTKEINDKESTSARLYRFERRVNNTLENG